MSSQFKNTTNSKISEIKNKLDVHIVRYCAEMRVIQIILKLFQFILQAYISY